MDGLRGVVDVGGGLDKPCGLVGEAVVRERSSSREAGVEGGRLGQLGGTTQLGSWD